MAKQNYDDSEGVWRTVSGRRIFIKNGQDLSDAMRESGKFSSNVTKKKKIKDVTDKWKENAKPKDGKIEVSEKTVAKSGKVLDESNAKLKKALQEDVTIGTWFKNNLWGDVELQRGVDFPQKEPSADILVLNNCPLIKEQTIEIKTIPTTVRKDGVETALKSAKSQSSNVLLDMTGSALDKSFIINEVQKFISNSDWLETVILKESNKLIAVYSK